MNEINKTNIIYNNSMNEINKTYIYIYIYIIV